MTHVPLLYLHSVLLKYTRNNIKITVALHQIVWKVLKYDWIVRFCR